MKRKQKAKFNFVVLLLTAAFIAIIITMIDLTLRSSAKKEIYYDTALQEKVTINIHEPTAFLMAKEFVKKRLKASVTAKFPSTGEVKYIGDGLYEIKSYVDSENRFGAMVRHRYTCVIKDIGDDDSWLLYKLTLNN